MHCEATFFFCKKITSYEVCISDWSSDVCSSDERARSGERLSADRLERRRLGRTARKRSRERREGRQGVDGRACPRDARFPGGGGAADRLRQQHPPDGEGRGGRKCVRLSRIRPCILPPPLLPRT